MILAAGLAHAEGFALRRPLLGHPVLDVRAGAETSSAHPFICAEVSPTAWLGVEGCGTGSGFLYPSTGPDLAHFRARARFTRIDAAKWEVQGLAGAGITEADRGDDAPGFRNDASEGVGPEGTLSVRGRWWLHPAAFLTGDVTAGTAWIPAAPEVLGTPGPWVPFLAVTVGAGF